MKTSIKAPILLSVATKWESEPLVRRWGLHAASPFLFEGSVRGVDVLVLKTGIGSANAAESLRAIAAPPSFVISTGFAGAIQPGIKSGDLVVEAQGLDLDIPQAARQIAATQRVALHFGKIAHTDKVLHDPRQKRSLGKAQRACAVDMESQALRVSAGRLGASFLAVRVILDGVDDRLPAEIPGENFGELASFVARNARHLPALARLGWLQRRAMARLAIFLEELLPRL